MRDTKIVRKYIRRLHVSTNYRDVSHWLARNSRRKCSRLDASRRIKQERTENEQCSVSLQYN